MTRAEREIRNKQMRQFKSQGKTMTEVAKEFNVSRETAQSVCKGISPQSTNKMLDDETVSEIVQGYLPDVEFAGNYTGCDGRVDLRCIRCGNVFNRSMISVRHKHCSCPTCRENDAANNKRVREQEKNRRNQERQRAKEEREAEEERKRIERMTPHPCPVCGELTTRRKYCSDKCANRAHNKTKEHARRTRIQKQIVDKDITLEGLFRRDKGICHICGRRCDFEDYTVVDGVFIAGDWYPSIDHIVPLSKEGKHKWGNVGLAHRRCNTKKGNKLE